MTSPARTAWLKCQPAAHGNWKSLTRAAAPRSSDVGRGHQYIRKPPDTLSVAPVMYLAWSEARKTTGPAISSGSAT